MAKWQERHHVSCGWVLKTGSNLVEYQCSKCNRWAVKWEGTMDYEKCPHCGADMREKKDDLAEIIEATRSMKEGDRK